MTKEHIEHKKFLERLSDRVTVRLPDDVKEMLFEYAKKNGLLEFEYITDLVIPFIRSRNGVEKLETEESLDGEGKFDCNLLCRKGRQCTSNAMFDLGEIRVNNCYVSRFPYEWTTPNGKTVRLCRFMFFPRGFPHDPENPYPQCRNPRPPIHLDKDRIVRDPQICWDCYKLRKKAREEKREEKLLKKATSDDNFRGQPRVNWGSSEGLPYGYYR